MSNTLQNYPSSGKSPFKARKIVSLSEEKKKRKTQPFPPFAGKITKIKTFGIIPFYKHNKLEMPNTDISFYFGY